MRSEALALFLSLASAAAAAFAGEAPTLNPDGYGGARIGMTVAEASAALGVPLTPEGEDIDPECFHVFPAAGPTELFFMVIDDRIARVSLYEGPSAIRTDKGIGLGDAAQKVREAYGETLADEEHEYLGPAARYLTIWDALSERGIRYETDTDGKVDKIHAGGEAIRLIEGCS